jgi:homospermidine synthase
MHQGNTEARFEGRLVLLGFGAVGKGVLPLLLRHIDMRPDQIEILQPSSKGQQAARELGVRHTPMRITRENYREVLSPRLGAGDFLVNLSVDVSSKALMALCQEREALYVDACTEPWPGTYTDTSLPAAERTNYMLRESVLALREREPSRTTSLITLGANPGLVSWFVKKALLDLAGPGAPAPAERADWARLAQRLGIRTIHVAERDTQVARERKKPGEFVNTWSVDGFVSEGLQPAELGWGTHERHFPHDGARHSRGSRAAIYLERPGAGTRVRSWTPLAGPYEGFLVTHAESISIADHLTLGDPEKPEYRPTVHYAYHPCDDAVLSLHELEGRRWRLQDDKRQLLDDIVSGRDELGVLLMGHERGVYWYGSRLTIEEARALCPWNSATTLQVTAPIMAGVIWALRNPQRGILEPDDLPHDEMLRLCLPYLGEVVGVRGDWSPLDAAGQPFPENLDRTDPWQFINMRVG